VWVRLSGAGSARLRVVKPRGQGLARGASRVLTVEVLPATAPSIATSQVPRAYVGVAYSQVLRTVGGREGAWSWQPGYSPPDWLHLRATTGRLTGTPGPVDVGLNPLVVRFTDALGRSATATLPLTVTTWTSVTLGGLQACGLQSDHTAWCWGADDYGQAGSAGNLGSMSPSSAPTQVGDNSDWVSLTAGDFHTCGIRSNGTAWCWGSNQVGELGTSANVATSTPNPVPSQVGTATDWAQLSAGHDHTCGVKADHTLWCWGANNDGQLGTATNSDTDSATPDPVQVGTDTDWVQVSAGGRHTCALKTDHTLWCWGANDFGQLGVAPDASTDTAQPVPHQVTGSWAAVAAGDRYTCATRTDRIAWCWGRNTDGQLGYPTNIGTDAPNPDPQQVGVDTDWADLAAGLNHTCAVKTDGTTWCWGDNTFGETSTAAIPGATATPTQLGTATSWSELTAGWGASCGLTDEGTVWCWGNNDAGQLGSSTNIGTATPNPAPVLVGSG
jgi:alpha-tubulin suppressor-like RCC1 family protein